MRRNRLLILMVILSLVVVVALGAWIVGSRITSPAEAAARTAPPTPSPILVAVEERILTSEIVTRGTARFGLPRAISIVPSSLKTNLGLLTSLPVVESQLQEGDVLLTVSGRPVFILQGEVPVFRDLVPGLVGEDVRQLEEALQRLGFVLEPIDGLYDEATSAAVAAWYTTNGWDAFGPTNEQIARIQSLEHDLADAINRQALAQDALLSAPLNIEAVHAHADSANLLAAADVTAKTIARDRIIADPNSTAEDQTIANAALDAAIAAETAIRLDGQQAVQEVINAQNRAQREVDLATNRVNQIRSDLDAARSETGVVVPADEIIYLPDLPVRVDELHGAIGDTIDGSVLTVTNNQLAIDSSLPLNEAPLVRLGMEVMIDEPELGIAATGVVTQVADTPGTFGVDGFHIYLEISVDKTPFTLQGFSLRLTIPLNSTGDAVTVVPISALSLAGDGSSRVQVENNGRLEFMVVEPGLAADGYVAVSPIDGTLRPGQMVVIGFEG